MISTWRVFVNHHLIVLHRTNFSRQYDAGWIRVSPCGAFLFPQSVKSKLYLKRSSKKWFEINAAQAHVVGTSLCFSPSMGIGIPPKPSMEAALIPRILMVKFNLPTMRGNELKKTHRTLTLTSRRSSSSSGIMFRELIAPCTRSTSSIVPESAVPRGRTTTGGSNVWSKLA